MFNKKRKFTEKIPGINISFIDTVEPIIISDIKNNFRKTFKRIYEFPHYFLEGMASVKSNEKDSPNYYIHQIKLKIYDDKEKLINERCNDFIIPQEKFKLYVNDKIFNNACYATISLYVTFNPEEKLGSIIHIKVYFG